jgi:hypothetical protein
MKYKIIITMGFILCIVYTQAQKNKSLLWVDKGSNGKYGIIDTAKNIIITYQFDEIKKLISDNIKGNEFFRTKLNGKYGIIDKFGKQIILPQYDEIKLRSQAADWIETKLNGKYGFAGFYKSEIAKKYEAIKEIFAPKYDSTFYSAGESAPSGFIKVKLNNKWGLVDEKNGKEITGMKYDQVSDFYFYQGLDWTEIQLNNKYGLIDKTGKEIIPCKYDKVLDIDGEGSGNEKIKVQQNGREFFINKLGKEIK